MAIGTGEAPVAAADRQAAAQFGLDDLLAHTPAAADQAAVHTEYVDLAVQLPPGSAECGVAPPDQRRCEREDLAAFLAVQQYDRQVPAARVAQDIQAMYYDNLSQLKSVQEVSISLTRILHISAAQDHQASEVCFQQFGLVPQDAQLIDLASAGPAPDHRDASAAEVLDTGVAGLLAAAARAGAIRVDRWLYKPASFHECSLSDAAVAPRLPSVRVQAPKQSARAHCWLEPHL
jgi:hypothetical protein